MIVLLVLYPTVFLFEALIRSPPFWWATPFWPALFLANAFITGLGLVLLVLLGESSPGLVAESNAGHDPPRQLRVVGPLWRYGVCAQAKFQPVPS